MPRSRATGVWITVPLYVQEVTTKLVSWSHSGMNSSVRRAVPMAPMPYSHTARKFMIRKPIRDHSTFPVE